MPLNVRQQKAIDFVADLTKQLITPSTGIVTITLLFSKDILEPRAWAVRAWALFLISTCFGLLALMTLTGSLAPRGSCLPDEDIVISGGTRFASALQIIVFGFAIVVTLFYVIFA